MDYSEDNAVRVHIQHKYFNLLDSSTSATTTPERGTRKDCTELLLVNNLMQSIYCVHHYLLGTLLVLEQRESYLNTAPNK
jgi:hypothetical protein